MGISLKHRNAQAKFQGGSLMQQQEQTKTAATCILKTTLAFIILACELVVGPARATAQDVTVTAVSLASDPPAWRGDCPATIRFTGEISVKGQGEIKYLFVRSDGATGPVNTLTVGPG